MEMQDSLLQLIYTIDEHYQFFFLNAQQLLGNATSSKIPFNPFLHRAALWHWAASQQSTWSMHFKHLDVSLGSIASCSLMLSWTVALDASVQNVVVPSWRWRCPTNAVCMLFSRIDFVKVF